MDKVIVAAFQGWAELLPDLPLEPGVGQAVDRLNHGPAPAFTHPQDLGQLPGRGGNSLGVDGGEVHALDPTLAQDGVAVADLCDKVDIGHAPQRLGQGPADKGDRNPFGVRRFGNDQNAGPTHGPAGGSIF